MRFGELIKNFNRSKVAETLNVSRQSILNYIKIFENEQKKKIEKVEKY